MTINEAITMADEMKPNMMSNAVKVRFLNEIEGKVHAEVIMKHVHSPEEADPPIYDVNTDQGTQMLVPAPYDMLYVYWIMAQIDHLNQEMDKYNNDRSLFENAWGNFTDWWNREHMPLSPRRYIHI